LSDERSVADAARILVEMPGEGRSRETRIRRDATGRWWNGDDAISHPSLARAFDGWIDRAEDGRYCLRNDVNWAYVAIEGPPLFARQASIRADAGETSVWLSLSDGREERLDLATLREGPDDALYCDARDGTLPCRLERSAMMGLADHLEEDAEGASWLHVGASRVRPARVDDPLVPARSAVVEAPGP